MINVKKVSVALLLLGFGILNASAADPTESMFAVMEDKATVYSPSQAMDGQWTQISLPQNVMVRVLRTASSGYAQFINYGPSVFNFTTDTAFWIECNDGTRFVVSGPTVLQAGETQSKTLNCSNPNNPVHTVSVTGAANLAAAPSGSVLPPPFLPSAKYAYAEDWSNDGIPVVINGDGVTVSTNMGTTTATIQVENHSSYNVELGYLYETPKSAATGQFTCIATGNKIPRTRAAVVSNPFQVGDVLAPGQAKVVTGTCPTGYNMRNTFASVQWEYSYLLPPQ